MKTETTFTKDRIIELIATNDKMVERSLVEIFKLQTAEEQVAEATRFNNGVGFNGIDAKILSSFAKQVINSMYPEGRRLSEKQRLLARKKLPKYAAQLLRIHQSRVPQIWPDRIKVVLSVCRVEVGWMVQDTNLLEIYRSLGWSLERRCVIGAHCEAEARMQAMEILGDIFEQTPWECEFIFADEYSRVASELEEQYLKATEHAVGLS